MLCYCSLETKRNLDPDLDSNLDPNQKLKINPDLDPNMQKSLPLGESGSTRLICIYNIARASPQYDNQLTYLVLKTENFSFVR
jgi:hypothetical protein